MSNTIMLNPSLTSPYSYKANIFKSIYNKEGILHVGARI